MAFHPLMSLKKRLAKLRKGPVTVQRLGATWQLYPRDWIDNRLFIGRRFETAQLDFTESIINDRQIDALFDCGSNIGLYSVLLGIRCPQLSSIDSFEPVPATWARLKTNLSLNDLMLKASPHNFGLGVTSERTAIALDPKSSGTASLSQDVKAQRGFTETQEIEICVFDQKFTQSGQRAFFKIDVEGHEIQALKGMTNYLKNNDCILQVEAWDNNQDALITFLTSQGYQEFHRIGPDIYFEKAQP